MRSPGIVLAVGLALSPALLACGGGGGGGGGPTQPQSGITFTASGSGAADSVSMADAGSTSTTLRVDVRSNGIPALYGVSFDVVYPTSLLSFSAATAGGLLGGVNTSFQAKEVSPGRVVIGFTRLGAVAGVSGSGTLVTLEFASRGVAGSGSLSFDKTTAFDSNAKSISGVTWSGGSLTVVP